MSRADLSRGREKKETWGEYSRSYRKRVGGVDVLLSLLMLAMMMPSVCCCCRHCVVGWILGRRSSKRRQCFLVTLCPLLFRFDVSIISSSAYIYIYIPYRLATIFNSMLLLLVVVVVVVSIIEHRSCEGKAHWERSSSNTKACHSILRVHKQNLFHVSPNGCNEGTFVERER